MATEDQPPLSKLRGAGAEKPVSPQMRDSLEQEELEAAFRTGAIFNASDEDLERYLRRLSTGPVLNDATQHRAIIRAHIIDTVRLFRFTDRLEEINRRFTERLEASNRRLNWVVVCLTAAAVGLAIVSAWTSIENTAQDRSSSQQATELLNQQRTEIAAEREERRELERRIAEGLEGIREALEGSREATE